MSSNIFIISDTHFGHDNMYKFVDDAGNPARAPYTCAAECDEVMVQNWNSIVKPHDKVYHLGDVAIKRKEIEILKRCNGKKVLVRGNHDIYDLSDYTPYFYDIRGSHKLENLILSHYPLHPESLPVDRWCKGNVHGHVHLRSLKDPRYFNACVELNKYSPISFEQIKKYYENLSHP
jgi:calcineurin-like phosphoesterase family protein